MDWLNPVEWAAWIYGKVFQNHAGVGGVVFVGVIAAVGLLVWIRGVDKYKEDHRPKLEAGEQSPKSQAVTSQAQTVTANPPQTAPPTQIRPRKSPKQRNSDITSQQSTNGERDTLDIRGGSFSGGQAAIAVDGNPFRGTDVTVEGGTYTDNQQVVQNWMPNTNIRLKDVTALRNKAVVSNGIGQSQPTIRQDCGGGNCAISMGQQRGVTAGQVNMYGPRPRISSENVAKLAAQLSKCSPGATMVMPSVNNPSGTTDEDASNLVAAFARAQWSYSGVSRQTHGQDIGSNGPIPDPAGIHIKADQQHQSLAVCVQEALKSINVESFIERGSSTADVLEILVGNAK